MVEYCVELFDSDPTTFAPRTRLTELWEGRNLGWSWYDRIASKAFLTLSQNDRKLSYLSPLTTHVKITRVAKSNVTVYSGIFVDYNSTEDDVVLSFVNYVSLLALSRSGYRTMYASKKLGTEIVSPEWVLAKGVANSPLSWVANGTIEDPLGNDGSTAIKTNTQFGTMDQMRLQLIYDLSEMGKANTDNRTTFGITRDNPTFYFLKNAGTTRSFGLDLNGRVTSYNYLPNWSNYRNDLGTIAQSASGGTSELVVKDNTAAAAKGRRQDVFTIQTLLGIATGATETDQQVAAANRILKRGLSPIPALQLSIEPGTLELLDGWDVNDKVPVSIVNGIDNITGLWRIAGVQALVDEGGEHPYVFVEP